MLADGKIDDFEDAMMRKIVDFFISLEKDSSEARQKASMNLNNQIKNFYFFSFCS